MNLSVDVGLGEHPRKPKPKEVVKEGYRGVGCTGQRQQGRSGS